MAAETLLYFIHHRAAPNLHSALELVCWIARKVLATPELADQVLKDLPQSPEAVYFSHHTNYWNEVLEAQRTAEFIEEMQGKPARPKVPRPKRIKKKDLSIFARALRKASKTEHHHPSDQ